ncbi:MAG TPA: hypothetical protein VGL25_02535 [Casimicrobiaceae bacterium]|jgi:hypothetical protein
MRVDRLVHRLICLIGAPLLLVGCAAQIAKMETPRTSDERPSAAAERAVAEYKARDPDASFTFVAGSVDAFATSAKAQVPDYALPVLANLGLSTTARPVVKLLTPMQGPIRSRDLDATDQALPFVRETPSPPVLGQGTPDAADARSDRTPPAETRVQATPDAERMVEWTHPDRRTLALEQQAAAPILKAFLQRNAQLFDVDPSELERTLRATTYQSSAYFRKATFDQYVGGEKVLYGRTLVHFDLNWNVIGISRMIMTPSKLRLQAGTADAAGGVDQQTATRAALAVPPQRECQAKAARTVRVERAVDIVRGVRVYDVELASADGDCHWRTIVDAASGRVLNTTDLVDRAFTDARVNRWRFSGGDLFAPNEIVSTSQYTRNDRRLEHDFFYMMNDHRCEGAAETACTETGFTTNWCEKAYGTTSGSSFVRATRRTDRDFSSYFPGATSETFAETNAYYWARQFAQWLKPSLDAMGVLPGSANDYSRVLMITDACRSGSVHNASFAVTTEDDKGEGTNVIRIAHRNPAGSANHNAACEGGGCFDNPSNLHHEMNHFFLKRYYDVGSDLDCGGANQLKFIHEGALGTAVPQAFWHGYYGVGYNPSSTNKLYFSNSNIGRVHTNDTNRMTIGGFLCVNNTDDPYVAGRVVGQALWEFYHGIKVSGSSMTGTWHPTTDTDFNWIVYWAADLMAASTYKDRYEYANRLMEILDKHTNWSSDGKRDYCEIFEHHGLRDYVNADYCS